MNTCNHTQSQLLPYLYDLLEAEERRALAVHLEACEGCRQALEKTREQAQLLREAAKEEFAGVQFAPATLPLQNPSTSPMLKKQPTRWRRWALAASVLFMVLGGGGVWRLVHLQHQVHTSQQHLAVAQGRQQQFLSENQQTLKAHQDAIGQAQTKVTRLVADWNKEAEITKRTLRDKQVEVVITGPKTLQAGAANQFHIELKAPKGQALPQQATLKTRVVDPATKNVLFEKETPNQAHIKVELPRDLPLKPGSDLTLEVVALAGPGLPVQVQEALSLTTPQYITHLATDRPMYRPGEVVRFRSLTLERFSLTPPKEDLFLKFAITDPNNQEKYSQQGLAQVKGDDGTLVLGPGGRPLTGLGAGEFAIPADLPGGEYTLTVRERNDRFPAEKRTFIINNFAAPRLNKELRFTRSSYGAGDMVEVLGQVAAVEGGRDIALQPAQATVTVDGQVIASPQTQTDAKGHVKFNFTLPQNLERGQGTVAIRFQDDGIVETIVRPIPIVLKKLFVDFFPEGGDLVAGVPSRVYFQAKTNLGKPAELKGRIVDAQSNVAATVQTLHDDSAAGVNQGMGSFTFTPEAGKSYELKIDSPIGTEGRHPLPAVRADGVVLRLPEGVVEKDIQAVVTSGQKDRRLLIGAYCRGKQLDQVTVEVKAGKANTITLHAAEDIGGVYRITVFEIRDNGATLVPIAERLIYRQAGRTLNFVVEADKDVYHPGDPVKVKLRARDEKGQSAPAVVVASVVDLSVLKLADEKTARAMPTHFFLTTEVRKPEDLENADFLLSDHPKATTALDLLLGTQGWRRFAEQDPGLFAKKQQDEAQRFLALTGQAPQQFADAEKQQMDRLAKKFAPEFIVLQKELAKTEAAQADEQQKIRARTVELQHVTSQSQQVQARSRKELEHYQEFLLRFVLVALVLGLLLGGLGFLAWGLWRSSAGQAAKGLLVTGACLLGVLLMGGLAVLVMSELESSASRTFWSADKTIAFREQSRLQNDAKAVRNMPAPEEAVKGLWQDNAPMQKGPMPWAKLMPTPALPAPYMKAKREDKIDVNNVDDPTVMFEMQNIDGALQNAVVFRKGGVVLGLQPGLVGQDVNPQQELRRRGRFEELAQMYLTHPGQLPLNLEPFLVREYAHQHQPQADGTRHDFTPTLYWHPALVLADGSVDFGFNLADSVTRYQVAVMGHTQDGRLGTGVMEIAARMPFSVEPKAPLEVTSSDFIFMPVIVANASNQAGVVELTPKVEGLNLWPVQHSATLSIGPGQRLRHPFIFQPSIKDGVAKLHITAKSPLGTDAVEKTIRVVPEGFPALGSHSDLLEKTAQHRFVLPASWLEGTLDCQVQIFPSTLADLQKGLEGLLREPHGCFEQSSSSNYPNVMILSYLQETNQSQPEVETKARQLLDKGYQKLTGFECLKKSSGREGYEWFGGAAPPHEALTAYGLLQFRDMAKVHPVDKAMLERTQQYLLSQRDGAGGFKRNPRALDSFGRAPDHVTNAYIVWALSESGADADLTRELDTLFAQAKDGKDSYFAALVASSLINRGRAADALEVLKTLQKHQEADGHVGGAQTSITRSAGRTLDIETTALATLAWLKANQPQMFHQNIDKAVRWLNQQRGGMGGYGTTQSTILALKALIAFTRENKNQIQPGNLQVVVNGKTVSTSPISRGLADVVTVALPPAELRPGENHVQVSIGDNVLPWTLSWSYQTLKPVNPKNAPVVLSTSLNKDKAREGETVRVTAVVENKSGQGQGMAVAVLGLPGGLTLPEDMTQLKDLARLRDNDTKPGTISAWEIRGRELVLYWRDLAPDAKITVELDLICQIPGQYRGPASRAYLYYKPDLKHWEEPLAIRIDQ